MTKTMLTPGFEKPTQDGSDAKECANRPIVWSIAASDSSGHAGIQADLATFNSLNVHGCNVITAITAQNSEQVRSVSSVALSDFIQQIDVLRSDLPPKAIKLGLLGDIQQVTVLAEALLDFDCFVVLDPVMKASTGDALMEAANIEAIKSLFPVIDMITPNLNEASALTGMVISTPTEIEAATKHLHESGVPCVLIKGGHGVGEQSRDYLSISTNDTQLSAWLVQPRLPANNHRGTGCTLSSAIASFVALGESIEDSVTLASAFVHRGLKEGYQPGHGAGPIVKTGFPNRFDDFPKVCDRLSWLTNTQFPDCGQTPLGLYPVVDSIEWLNKLLPLGITTLQLRIKNMPELELEDVIRDAVALGKQYQCRLFINDYWQLAMKYGAYGVHLGQEDIAVADLKAIAEAGIRLGVSTHGDFEWARAATLKPSYIAIGAIYPTDTKEVQIVGPEKLARWAQLLKSHFPLTAIGGINLGNLDEVLASGIDSVAVVSAITKSNDIQGVVSHFQHQLDSK